MTTNKPVIIERRAFPLSFQSIFTTFMVVVGGLSAYFGAQVANAKVLGDYKADIRELTTNDKNQDERLDRQEKNFDELNRKIDTLLIDRGYNPDKITKH